MLFKDFKIFSFIEDIFIILIIIYTVKIGIIGFGKVGSSLYDLLREKSIKVNIFSVTKGKGNLNDLVKDSELIFITVKDDLIPLRIKDISKIKGVKGKHFIHLSGATPLSILKPLKKKGNLIGKLHPVQTFPERNRESFKDIYATFSGDEKTFKVLKRIFSKDFKIIKMDEKRQILIHIACVFASNFPLYSILKAEEIVESLKLKREILKPILNAFFKNAIIKGAKNSLTGPAKRRDLRTIKLHKKILKNFKKDLYEIYNYLTEKILNERNL